MAEENCQAKEIPKVMDAFYNHCPVSFYFFFKQGLSKNLAVICKGGLVSVIF